MSLTSNVYASPLASRRARTPGRQVREKLQTLGAPSLGHLRGACRRLTTEHRARRRRAAAAPPAPAPVQQLRGPVPHLRAAVTSRGLLYERHRRRTETAQEGLGPIVASIADQRSNGPLDQVWVGLQGRVLAHGDLRGRQAVRPASVVEVD